MAWPTASWGCFYAAMLLAVMMAAGAVAMVRLSGGRGLGGHVAARRLPVFMSQYVMACVSVGAFA